MGRLDGKVAVVTGSNRGIGRGIAMMFASEGAAVVVTGRSPDRGQAVADEIVAAGGRAVSITADIGDEASVKTMMDQASSALGGLDILVNNAAPLDDVASAGSPIDESDTDMTERILRIGLLGPYFAIKHAVPHMQRGGGGSIVNISTTATITGLAGQPAYSMSKGGLNALTVNVAYDLRTGHPLQRDRGRDGQQRHRHANGRVQRGSGLESCPAGDARHSGG